MAQATSESRKFTRESVEATLIGVAFDPLGPADLPSFRRFWAEVKQRRPRFLRRFERPMDQLLALLDLPAGWDSYGGPPVAAPAAARAVVLLVQSLLDQRVPAPHVCPVPGGGVQLEWQAGRRGLELEALPDGSAQFLKVDGDAMQQGEVDPGSDAVDA